MHVTSTAAASISRLAYNNAKILCSLLFFLNEAAHATNLVGSWASFVISTQHQG